MVSGRTWGDWRAELVRLVYLLLGPVLVLGVLPKSVVHAKVGHGCGAGVCIRLGGRERIRDAMVIVQSSTLRRARRSREEYEVHHYPGRNYLVDLGRKVIPSHDMETCLIHELAISQKGEWARARPVVETTDHAFAKSRPNHEIQCRQRRIMKV